MKQSHTWKEPSVFFLRVEGPEAGAFLNRLTTVAVPSLSVGEGRPGLLLNAQGRMQAFFSLWKQGPTHFFLEGEELTPGAVFQALDRLHFGENLLLIDESAARPARLFFAAGRTLSETGLPEAGRCCAWEGGWGVGLPFRRSEGLEGQAVRFWGPPGVSQERWERCLPQGSQTVSEKEWDVFRLHQGWPRVGREVQEARQPLEVGLGFAVAGQKGCYPGQEVVEKMRSFGASPRKGALARGAGLISPGMSFPGGEVLSAGEGWAWVTCRKNEAHKGVVLSEGLEVVKVWEDEG